MAAKGNAATQRLRTALALSGHQKLSARTAQKKTATRPPQSEYKPVKVIGQGAFGVVYCARAPDGDLVAIKKVLIDPRYKNRELETMQSMKSRYVIGLRGSFKTAGKKPKEIFLNLVMDYLPMSLHQFNINYRKERKYPPLLYVKLFAFQMFAGLHYMHSIGITHRDLKPQNMLVDPDSGELKICDLGSAKKLSAEEPSVSYIASRYYRPPELMFDCVFYSEAIDVWAAGCCLAEVLMAGMPMFVGSSSIGQLHEIVKVIGPPTEAELSTFQHSQEFVLAAEATTTIKEVLPRHTPPDILELLKQIFVYSPSDRPTALQCMQHECFDELFESDMMMPSKRPFPLLERKEAV